MLLAVDQDLEGLAVGHPLRSGEELLEGTAQGVLVDVARRREECEHELLKAEPNLVKAAQALDTLTKSSIAELRTFKNPPEDVKKELMQDSDTTSVCGWKGTAKYFHVLVGDETNRPADKKIIEDRTPAECLGEQDRKERRQECDSPGPGRHQRDTKEISHSKITTVVDAEYADRSH